MNKNAAIIEGDITKKFNPVSKVKVSNSDTGESTWIPEESKETHSLSVIKNGIYYAASEGYTAYDTVTVNVSSETEVNYEGIIADMPDLADLGLYDLDDLEGLEGLDLDLDELQDLENLILDGDLAEGEIPESGATIKGIDPDSGETLEVGLDEDGNLMEQVLPDHIHIVVYPRKRHYQEGEIIDFSGIHVYLMKKGTERFTCEQYPTGEIPFEELVFPETIASGEGSHGRVIDVTADLGLPDDLLPITLSSSPIVINFDNTYVPQEIIETTAPTSIGLFIDNPDSESYKFIVTVEASKNSFVQKENDSSYGTAKEFTYGNKTVYYASFTMYTPWVITSINGSVNAYNPLKFIEKIPELAWVLVYGTIEEGEKGIPVQWMRSDGEILEDTFEIEIVSEDVPEPEPEPDPYADACDFIWEGKKYCFNKSLARSEVMYSNGTVWQTWLGGQSPPYTVDQALKLKLIVQVGWSGGGSTSGGF